jgi:glutathione synthase/RimK-type ligase-like ATP-grasp enzyme
LTDDRAYFVGFLKSAFEEVMVTRAGRQADTVTEPPRRPDAILNLVSARNRQLLDDIDAKGRRFGVPVSPPSAASWRCEDKRTYPDVFADACPPTRVVRDLEALQTVRRELGGDVVVKDPFGDRGRGVERVRSDGDLPIAEHLLANTVCDSRELVVQPYLSGFAKGDKRVLVQRTPENGFRIVAYIERRPPPDGWKSNIRNGGLSLPTELAEEEAAFALALAPLAGLDNAAFDIAEHDGRLYYIEHNQGYGGIIDFDLQQNTCNIRHCADFLLHLARHGRPDAAPAVTSDPAAGTAASG